MNLTASLRARATLAAGLATVVLSALPSPASATGGIAVGVFPDFPTRIDQGATNVAASVNVINSSSGAGGTGPITVTELTLVPSCGNFSPTCAGGADPGLFALSPTGTGAAGTSCAGRTFDITVVDDATGRVRFALSGGAALQVAATDIASDLDTCRVRFTVSSLKMPAVDSYPSLGEAQTNQVGFLSVRHGTGATGTDQGEDVTTVVPSATTPPTTPPTAPPPTTTIPTTAPPPPTTTTMVKPTTTTAPPPTTTTTVTPPPPTTTTTVKPTTTTTTTTTPATGPPKAKNPWWWSWFFGD